MNIRAFIAIPVSPQVKASIQSAIMNIKTEIPNTLIRWIPESNFHVTLKFLGEVSFDVLNNISSELGMQTRGIGSFEMNITSLGAFPNNHKPRVIWIGGKGPDELFAIVKIIEGITREYGIPEETRPFSPHFSIGRVLSNLNESHRALLHDSLEKHRNIKIGTMRVNEIEVIKSDLKQSGAIYSVLYKLGL